MRRYAADILLAVGCSSASPSDFDHGGSRSTTQGGALQLPYPSPPYGTVGG